MRSLALCLLLASSLAFDVTSHYVIAQIAATDLQQNHASDYKQAVEMLEPLHELSGGGEHIFLDAVAWPSEVLQHGESLSTEWHYQNNAIFNGVDEHEVEDYDRFNLLNEMTYSLFAVDASSNSRIDKTFSKSYMLRFIMNLIGEAHSPMHNNIEFDSKHKQGDNHGRDHKIKGSHATLFDLWENSFGMFPKQTYPISSEKDVAAEAALIMQEFPRSELEAELKNDSKKGWSDASLELARSLAYTLAEGSTPSEDYLEQGKAAVRKQIALAGYRISD
jgi:hypothetical protein